MDEDLSVEGLLAGRKSGEGRRSLERWLEARKAGHSVELRDLLNAARWRREVTYWYQKEYDKLKALGQIGMDYAPHVT